MSDTFRFPFGYDVTVCREQDIIEYLELDTEEEEIMFNIIDQCELDAANFLKQGRWTGIPYIGNIRIPETKKILNSEENKALIEDAKQNLDIEKYNLFRKELNYDIKSKVKQERYYRYVVSKFVSKNSKLYKNLSRTKGDAFARLICYTISEFTIETDTINYE